MRYLASMTAAALVALSFSSAEVRAHACPYTAMVESWYHRYLHRAPDPGGLHTWVSALRCGASPEDVQASILSSEEYFCAHKHCDTGYVAGLFTDVLGRAPCEHETREWAQRLRMLGCRKRLALEFFGATGHVAAHRAARPVVAIPAGGHRHYDGRTWAPANGHRHGDARFAAPVAPQAPMVLPGSSHGARFAATYPRR